ncbi:hypothetical protein BJY52DRAFT_1303226 [Lactarius psammicola]|nr:hypothetical protein BJY52DRAFT_1303226 [Lactarius psammicola]
MRFATLFTIAGAGLAVANPPPYVSPLRLGHAAANMGPPAASGFSEGQPKPRVRHLCKNMQKAMQGTASRLLAFIGIGGPSLAVTAPVPEGGVTRIQITTTSSAPHKFAPVPVAEPFAPMPGGPQAGGNRFTILPMPYPVYQAQEDRFDGPFLHRVHRALMTLGPWEGRMVAFVLGVFLMWDWRPCAHVLGPDGVARPRPSQQPCPRARGRDDYLRVRRRGRSSVRSYRREEST